MSEPEFEIRPQEIARQFELEAVLTLGREQAGQERFVARRTGSRLGNWSWKFDVEGSSSRMPIEIIDFPSRMISIAASEARWFVDWSSRELHLPIARQMSLLINERAVEFRRLVEENDPVVASVLACAVAESILQAALEDHTLDPVHGAYPDGSLGQIASQMLLLCFPGKSPEQIRTFRERSPAHYGSVIQALYWEI